MRLKKPTVQGLVLMLAVGLLGCETFSESARNAKLDASKRDAAFEVAEERQRELQEHSGRRPNTY